MNAILTLIKLRHSLLIGFELLFSCNLTSLLFWDFLLLLQQIDCGKWPLLSHLKQVWLSAGHDEVFRTQDHFLKLQCLHFFNKCFGIVLILNREITLSRSSSSLSSNTLNGFGVSKWWTLCLSVFSFSLILFIIFEGFLYFTFLLVSLAPKEY